MDDNNTPPQTPPATEDTQDIADRKLLKKALVKIAIITILIIIALYFSSNENKQVLIYSFVYGIFCFAINSFISLRRILMGLNVASSPGFFVSNSFFRMGLFGLMVVIALKYFSLNLLMIFIGFFLPFLFIIYERIREMYYQSKKIDKILK